MNLECQRPLERTEASRTRMQWCTQCLELEIDGFVFPGLGQLVKEEHKCFVSHFFFFSDLIFPKRKITQILTSYNMPSI